MQEKSKEILLKYWGYDDFRASQWPIIADSLNGNDVLLTSKSINIEEFMPDRIKVDVTAKEAYKTGETVNLVATATNLFGPPASNRNYEMDFSLKSDPSFCELAKHNPFFMNT
jgi:uncharacterized protein YfaS (alpha-2-macroglobulin family)